MATTKLPLPPSIHPISDILNINIAESGVKQIHNLPFRPDSSPICSGRGECVCGTCECNFRRGNSEEKYSGKWCQCDDYNCPFYDGALCGGS